MRGLSENLQCTNPSFFINWLDPFDLSKRKKLSDLCYICPRGTREGMPLCFFEKSVFVKHTSVYGKKYLLAHGPKCVHTAQCASIHGNQTREAFQLIVEAENKLKILRLGTFVPLFTVPRRHHLTNDNDNDKGKQRR